MILLQCYWKKQSHTRNKGKGNRLVLGTDFSSNGMATGRSVTGEEIAMSFYRYQALDTNIIKAFPSL